jgi:hypothetical protein
MPSSDQSRLFWLKWIDRQYAKADPSDLKMRPEDSKPEKDTKTVAEVTEQERTNNLLRLAISKRK